MIGAGVERNDDYALHRVRERERDDRADNVDPNIGDNNSSQFGEGRIYLAPWGSEARALIVNEVTRGDSLSFMQCHVSHACAENFNQHPSLKLHMQLLAQPREAAVKRFAANLCRDRGPADIEGAAARSGKDGFAERRLSYFRLAWWTHATGAAIKKRERTVNSNATTR